MSVSVNGAGTNEGESWNQGTGLVPRLVPIARFLAQFLH